MSIDGSSVGLEGVLRVKVEQSLSADAYGNPGLRALATPALVGLFEQAAMRAVEASLEAGERTVGSVVDMRHQAPTPVGDTVTITARVDEVDGGQVWFAIEALDAKGVIASGRHGRVVVDDERFSARLARHPANTAAESGG